MCSQGCRFHAVPEQSRCLTIHYTAFSRKKVGHAFLHRLSSCELWCDWPRRSGCERQRESWLRQPLLYRGGKGVYSSFVYWVFWISGLSSSRAHVRHETRRESERCRRSGKKQSVDGVAGRLHQHQAEAETAKQGEYLCAHVRFVVDPASASNAASAILNLFHNFLASQASLKARLLRFTAWCFHWKNVSDC